MNKNWVLSQEAFDKLLAWLDSDREMAGKKYEDIRRRLIKIFNCRGCLEAEALADETINRVTGKVQALEADYSGEPAAYFYGVARKVLLEYLRKKRVAVMPPPEDSSSEIEEGLNCLDNCMQHLDAESRQLVLNYYQDEKQAKINHRKEYAQQSGISLNALRIRAFRLRAILQECVRSCLEERATV